MFAISQLVDIPQIFRRLDALPQELATARQELWAAKVETNEALKDYEQVNDEDEAGRKEAWGCFATMQDEQRVRSANLDNLLDELSTLRAKIDLITALTMGCQETSESILLRQLLNAVRSTPGPVEQTALEDGPPPEDLRAGNPFPF